MNLGNNLQRNPQKKLATETRCYGYIQQASTIDDGRGGETVTWVNAHAQPHAFAVLPLSARQVMEYKSINVEATHMIKIRGEISVSKLNRISFNSRVFEILTVENLQERGIIKILTCKERRS